MIHISDLLAAIEPATSLGVPQLVSRLKDCTDSPERTMGVPWETMRATITFRVSG